MTEARVQAAYHEAGHAVVACVLGVDVLGASILPDEHTTGRICHGQNLGEAFGWVVVVLAGGIAEQRCPAGWEPDQSGADLHLVEELNYRDLWACSLEQIAKVRQEQEARARELVDSHWPAIERVAGVLLECEEINGGLVSLSASQFRP